MADERWWCRTRRRRYDKLSAITHPRQSRASDELFIIVETEKREAPERDKREEKMDTSVSVEAGQQCLHFFDNGILFFKLCGTTTSTLTSYAGLNGKGLLLQRRLPSTASR